jgi:peptidoglycan/LPS O-acetylase OafA/YrhL
MKNLKYRADIDGLRAVAVIGVLLFHTGLSFPGGFVGVDIFFVISGFLITSVILKAQQEDRFSMLEFLGRRIRRLMPAALAMTAVTMVFGFWLLIPKDYDAMAESAIAQMAIASNLYFANSLNYFSGPAELMPLLHTWSLAVEEQFYLIFPLLLIFCRKLSRNRLCIVLALFAAVSFGLNLWATQTYPTVSFFILPTRAWEMLLGALLIFLPSIKPTQRKVAEVGSLTAFAVILFVFFTYDKTTLFPGAAALWPCLATAALIYYNNPIKSKTILRSFLEHPGLTYIGKISYSLYLWHWPIVVYIRYMNHLELNLPLSILVLLLSFAAGAASYHFIETPFRTQRLFPRQKRLVLASTVCSFIIIGLGVFISEGGGLPGRWNAEINEVLASAEVPGHYMKKSILDPQRDQLPTIGVPPSKNQKTKLLLWGDSHVMVIGEVCNQLATEYNIGGYIAAKGGTVPVMNVYRPSDRNDTLVWNEGVMNFIKRHQITHIIMGARWSDNIEGNSSGLGKFLITDDKTQEISKSASRQVFRKNLYNTLSELNQLGIQVWIMEQVPFQHYDPVYEVVTALKRNDKVPFGVSREQHTQRQQNVRAIFRSIDLPNVTIIDPSPTLFTEQGYTRLSGNKTLYYFDSDHLSMAGANLFIKPVLKPIFKAINQSRVANASGVTLQ